MESQRVNKTCFKNITLATSHSLKKKPNGMYGYYKRDILDWLTQYAQPTRLDAPVVSIRY